jgi:hypothetical protein
MFPVPICRLAGAFTGISPTLPLANGRRRLALLDQRQPCYGFAHPFNGRAHSVLILAYALDVVCDSFDANDIAGFLCDGVQVVRIGHDHPL